MDFDILIIGSGPGGYVAAIKGAQNGKKVCIIEKEDYGGTCLNIGCIPTKTLLKSVELMDNVKKSSAFGIDGVEEEKINMNLDNLQKKKNEVVTTLVSGVKGLLKKNNVETRDGIASIKDTNTVTVDGNDITGDVIILATGSVARMLDIPTNSKMPVLNSTDVLNLTKKYNSMVIVGGGVVGIELAYFLSKIGVNVTIIEFLDRILPMVDLEITREVEKHIRSMGIELITSATLKEICSDKVVYSVDGSTDNIKCDAVMMSVGRDPNIQLPGLDKLGLKIDRGAIVTDGHMKTNINNIYAIGDVNGKSMLAHTASMEGLVAISNICGNDDLMDYNSIPSAVYISPEIASVGLTEEQAKLKYGDVKIGKFPMRGNGKSLIEGDQNGFIKIICNKEYGEILGAHLYCVHATDMISELTLAMELECTADELIKVIHPHPTVSESVGEAAHAVEGLPIHF